MQLLDRACFLGLPDHAPLASYGWDSSVRVVRYGRFLQAGKKVVAKSPDEFALHSLRIGGATALTAGGETFGND